MFLCDPREMVNRKNLREIWNAATVAKCWNLLSKKQKRSQTMSRLKWRKEKSKTSHDNDHIWCVFSSEGTHSHIRQNHWQDEKQARDIVYDVIIMRAEYEIDWPAVVSPKTIDWFTVHGMLINISLIIRAFVECVRYVRFEWAIYLIKRFVCECVSFDTQECYVRQAWQIENDGFSSNVT